MHRLGRPGGDLLSRALRRSTIGPGGLNDRVRNGIGWGPPGKTTRSTKPMRKTSLFGACIALMSSTKNDQADRAISTSKLHASRHFHTRPINVVVYHGSQGNSRFEVGFPLRCFQRLSRPYIAMQHCRWRDNCSTRGTFIPVLSY